MGLVNRFLLFLYALAVAVFALGVIALFLQVVPTSTLENEIKYLLSRWELVVGAVFVFLLSIHFVGCSVSSSEVSRKASNEVIVLNSESGVVNVSLAGIKEMLKKAILTVGGVNNAKVELALDGEKQGLLGVNIDVALSLYQGQNILMVSDFVRTKVAEAMKGTLGIDNYIMNISVEDMSGAVSGKKKRVV